MSSSETTTAKPEFAPFFVGVTGYKELAEGEAEPLKERLSRLFDFLRHGGKGETLDKLVADLVPDEKETKLRRKYRDALEGWAGLSKDTPIVVMTNLAPGVDTLVANLVLDVFKRKNFRLCCPLPFPAHIYCGSNAFVRTKHRKPDVGNLERQKEFLRLLVKMGVIGREFVKMARGTAKLPAKLSQALKEIQNDKLFPVLLEEDDRLKEIADRHDKMAENWEEQLASEATALEDKFSADRDNEERRDQRYYAASEFLAVSVHLMIVVWNGERDEESYGLPAIVESRLIGPRVGLLPTTSYLPMHHGGPLWHLRAKEPEQPDADIDRCAETPNASLPPLRFLYPYTIAGRDCPSARIVGAGQPKNIELQTERLGLFARIGENLSNFNSRRVPKRESRDEEYRKKFTEPSFAECLERESPQLATGLRRVSGFGCRGSELSDYYQGMFKRTLVLLFWLTLLAAISLHFCAHWHTPHVDQKLTKSQQKSHVDEPHSAGHDDADHFNLAQLWFGWGALLLAAGAVAYFARQRSRKLEPHGHDTRAIAEGLRVQFFWNLAGLGKSVSANYMSRHRSELDWVRGVIRETSMPYHQWKKHFTELPLKSQARALREVQSGWVHDQLKYFRNASRREQHRLHKWHTVGGVAALAGVLTFLKLVGRDSWLSVAQFFELACHAGVALPLLFVAGGWSWYRAQRAAVGKAASSRDNSVAIFPDLNKVFVNAWKEARNVWNNAPVKGPIDALQRLCVWSFVWVKLPFDVALEAVSILVPTHHDSAMTQTSFMRRFLHGSYSFFAHLPLALAIACAVHFLCHRVATCYDAVPSYLALDIIGGGVLLVVGALSVAWAEKNLHSEWAYQYSTMTGLFDAADARLDKELAILETAIDESKGELTAARKEQDESIKHIQALLYKLGQEALDENAEWLLLHRARPLEPVFAG